MKMFAPKDVKSASARGMPLSIAADGTVEVPADIAAELLSFGFSYEPHQVDTGEHDKDAAKKAVKIVKAEKARAESFDALNAVEGRCDISAVEAARASLAAAEKALQASKA